MKNLFLLATSVFFFCCTSQEITEVENETDSDRMILEKNPVLNLSEDLASESLVKLVRLINKDGSQYVFNTSKNEALQLGATVNEFEDVKDAVKFMNVKLGMAESEGSTIIMGNKCEKSTNLARSIVNTWTDRILAEGQGLRASNVVKAQFQGPENITVFGGSAALVWLMRFTESSKNQSFAFTNNSEDGAMSSTDVMYKAPSLLEPVSWNWSISNESGSDAVCWYRFKTFPFNPINTREIDPYVHFFPGGFDIYSDTYDESSNYYVTFTNRTGRTYSYKITAIGETEKKGSIQDGASLMLSFKKGVSYKMKLINERWGEEYTMDWFVRLW